MHIVDRRSLSSIAQTDSVPTTAPSVSGSVYYGKSDKAPDSSLSAVASVNDAAVGGGMVAVVDDGKVDAGILFTAVADGAAAAVMTISASAPTCAEGFLQCFDGKVRGTSIPCTTSCAGKCCVGTDACSRFTGNVCKDGSCSGTKACWYANIPYVVKSCKAIRACNSAGFEGTVGVIVNSCNFENSCAYAGEEGGKAGDIQNSCAAKKACYCAGTQTSGGIGEINTSCNAYKACYKAGAGYTTAGIITSDLVNCCNTESVCKNAKESTLPVQCPCPTTTKVRQNKHRLVIDYLVLCCTYFYCQMILERYSP